MDSMTSMIGNADAFPVLKHWNFLNHAAVAPQPKSGADVFRTYATQIETAAYLDAHWHPDIEKLREGSAKLINAHRDEIAFIKNTSEGICTVAKGIDWKPGDRIITTGVEYPANIYPWMETERLFWPQSSRDGPRRGCPRRITARANRKNPRRRLRSQNPNDRPFTCRVRQRPAARPRLRIGSELLQAALEILLSIDAIQSMGIVPVDVHPAHEHRFPLHPTATESGSLGPSRRWHLLLPKRIAGPTPPPDHRLDERRRRDEFRQIRLQTPPRCRPIRMRRPTTSPACYP